MRISYWSSDVCSSDLKGVRKGGADRAAVADADDVAPRMLPGESLDGGGDAPAEGGEALAAGRNLRRRGKPEVAPRLAVFGRERLVAATLPAAEVLLGQPRDRQSTRLNSSH